MRERILSEIKRIASENGGSPPGIRTFEASTGITDSAWLGKIWARWSDAIKEAGLEPNTIQQKYSTDHLLSLYCEAARQYGKAPTKAELSMFGRDRENFPAISTFYGHFGAMEQLRSSARDWAEKSEDFTDVVDLIPLKRRTERPLAQEIRGYVYLLKWGDNYKIGRSENLEKRIKEIRISLPDKGEVAHSIQTDDPPGIEAYWHRRFKDRRKNGEWFELTPADVKAFKKRKFQ